MLAQAERPYRCGPYCDILTADPCGVYLERRERERERERERLREGEGVREEGERFFFLFLFGGTYSCMGSLLLEDGKTK